MGARLAVYSTLRLHPWGAPDTLWARAAQEALAAGHVVFAVVRANIIERPEITALQAAGAEIRLVPDLVCGGRASRLAAIWRNVRSGAHRTLARLRSFRPDLLLINQGGFYDFIAEHELRAWIARGRIPYAVVAHSNYEAPAMEESVRATAIEFIGGARRFFAISRFIVELGERQLLARITNASVFQNPVEFEASQPLPWPRGLPPTFAVVSRLDAHGKGLDVLLPALREAPGLDADWRLNVYGEGPDRGYLEALARQCGLAERVAFHGYVADKLEIWRRNHLLLLPSRFEGCSYAMVEALLCGRPVLRTAYGGVAEWMPGGANGFLCAAAEPALLTAALADAWSRRADWEAMGRAAHAHASRVRDPQPHRTLLALLAA